MEGKVRFRAVGDNLIHQQLYEAARLPGGGYCFDGMYAHVKKLVQEADIAAINQETILVGDDSKVSSFPFFGSPAAVGEAIINAGFRVVTHASNHALDKKLGGIHSSIEFWRGHDKEVYMLGLHSSREDQEKICIIECNGIRIAMLNFTEKLNFHRLPASEPWCLDVMKRGFREKIRRRIEKARKESDFVIVFPHWGCEYLYEPIPSQMRWAKFFAHCGADLIVGTHSHVVQNVQWLGMKNGRRILCMYSLGNFVSCQVKTGTMLGAMADVVIERKEGKRARIVSDRLIPLVTHTDAGYSSFTVYPLAEYTDELAEENKIFQVVKKNYGITVDCAYLKKLFRDIIHKETGDYSEFKTPMDVNLSNFKAILNTARKKNTKA